METLNGAVAAANLKRRSEQARKAALVAGIRSRIAFYREERGRLVSEGHIDPSGPNVVDDLVALLVMVEG